MDYILTFAMDENGDEINVTDAFIAWHLGRHKELQQAGRDAWFYSPKTGFRRTSDQDGVALQTEGVDPSHLHEILSDFFVYAKSGKGYAAIASTNPQASVGVVLVSNDPAVKSDPPGSQSRGMVRRYQAAEILSDADLFGSIHDGLFGEAAKPKGSKLKPDKADTKARNTENSAWLFGDPGAAVDTRGTQETAFLIKAAGISPQNIFTKALNIAHVTALADDYFTYDDPANKARAIAQPLPTDAGIFTEIRLELPTQQTAEHIRLRFAAHCQAVGYSDIYLIQNYDDAKGRVEVARLHFDGTLGPKRMLTLKF